MYQPHDLETSDRNNFVFQFYENDKRELPGHEDMQTLRYIDFNRNSQFRIYRQQADGKRIQENATLWEWIYHAFEILNMTTIRDHWNLGFIGMIRRAACDMHFECRILCQTGRTSIQQTFV